jgi:hypothetical protein
MYFYGERMMNHWIWVYPSFREPRITERETGSERERESRGKIKQNTTGNQTWQQKITHL